jgi:hypothetical protein
VVSSSQPTTPAWRARSLRCALRTRHGYRAGARRNPRLRGLAARAPAPARLTDVTRAHTVTPGSAWPGPRASIGEQIDDTGGRPPGVPVDIRPRDVDEDARRDLQRSGNRRPGFDRQPDLMVGESARNARSASRCRARSSSSRCPRSATRLSSSAAVRVSALASVLALDHQMPPLPAMLRTDPQPDQFALWATPRSISCFSRVSPVQRSSTSRRAVSTAHRCSGEGQGVGKVGLAG